MHGHDPCGCEFCQLYDARQRAIREATPKLADGTAPGNERSPISVTSDKPCCRRIGNARWCSRDDGHAGDCDGAAARVYAEGGMYTRIGGGQ